MLLLATPMMVDMKTETRYCNSNKKSDEGLMLVI
jgi:hypothetical protein